MKIVGILIVTFLAIFYPLVAFPLGIIIQCTRREDRPVWFKVFWILVMLITWPLGCYLYAVLTPYKGKKISFILLIFTGLGMVAYFLAVIPREEVNTLLMKEPSMRDVSAEKTGSPVKIRNKMSEAVPNAVSVPRSTSPPNPSEVVDDERRVQSPIKFKEPVKVLSQTRAFSPTETEPAPMTESAGKEPAMVVPQTRTLNQIETHPSPTETEHAPKTEAAGGLRTFELFSGEQVRGTVVYEGTTYFK